MAARSPAVLTPLAKSSPAPNTPVVNKDSVPAPITQPVPFPSPQTFDILPPLHGLLLRLLSPQNNNENATNDVRPGEDPAGTNGPSSGGPGPSQAQQASHTQSQSQGQQQPSSGNENTGGLPSVSSAAHGSASAAAEIAALSSSAPPPLDIKNLPTEASSIKIRIQKAHAVVTSLPDVHRSVADQDKEIRELEDRIARLTSLISDLGKRAAIPAS